MTILADQSDKEPKKVRSAKRIREELLSVADQSELALNEVKGVLPVEPFDSLRSLMASHSGRKWYVYIRDRRGQLYTGITTDLTSICP